MDDEELIQETKKVLTEIYEEGFKIVEILKERASNAQIFPDCRRTERLFIHPKYFHFFLFDSFWKVFENISDNIESPLVQLWIRIILEQSSDFLWFSGQGKTEKEELACKYWLSTLGFLGGKFENLDYDKLLSLLEASSERVKFVKLREVGYPKKKAHDLLHHLFPLLNDNLPDFVEKYYLNLKGNLIRKSNLSSFFRDMCFYHHPSLIINQLEREFDDKSHIFRCFALLSICGICLIRFSIESGISSKEEKFLEDLNEKILNLLGSLYQGKK